MLSREIECSDNVDIETAVYTVECLQNDIIDISSLASEDKEKNTQLGSRVLFQSMNLTIFFSKTLMSIIKRNTHKPEKNVTMFLTLMNLNIT